MDINSSDRQSSVTFIVPLVTAVAFIAITFPVWRWLWQEWMGNDYYSHGLLIPFVSAYLALRRIQHDKTFAWRSGEQSTLALIFLALNIAIFLFFLNDKAYYLASFSLVGLVAVLIWALGGAIAIRKLLFPVAYLLLMIPLPFIEKSTLPLALFTGVCSGGLVRFLGLDITIVGNAVTLPNTDLVIGAQCSGINSIIALSALTILLSYLVEGSIWRKIGLMLMAIPLALIGNILRVSSLLFIARTYGAQAGFTFYHDYSGPIFFLISLLLLYPIALMLRCRTLRMDVI